MPQIQGIKGEAVVLYCEPLITKTPKESGRRPWGVIGFRSVEVLQGIDFTAVDDLYIVFLEDPNGFIDIVDSKYHDGIFTAVLNKGIHVFHVYFGFVQHIQ